MSLLNPHLGEILDRLSILSLKIREAALRLPEAECAHFVQERLDLLRVLKEQTEPDDAQTSDKAVDQQVWAAELGAVNGQLWELNKQAREDRSIALKDIHPLNDKRAELVRRLGSSWEEEELPTDKVY